MTTAAALEHGRDAFARRAWREAYEQLSAADRVAPLAGEDLERLAMASGLIGRDGEMLELTARAHQEWLRAGSPVAAARCAFWLAFRLVHRRETAKAGGWLGRARRLLEDAGADCAECGYLLLPVGIQSLEQGDSAAAYNAFERAGAIARRFGDTDLSTFARFGQGRALIALGRTEEGIALLDEAMVAVTADEVGPVTAGIVYCGVIDACYAIFDLRRAQEWTTALAQWCAAQPDLVPFRGACLVHHVEILQLHGAWPDAMDEVRRACERLAEPTPHPPIDRAHYERGELHRLRGELAEAEQAYREASRWGCEPQPGLALLRLAQGQLDAAVAGICRAVEETRDPPARARLLPALVEVALAAGDAARARAAADELARIAESLRAPFLRAASAQAWGAVELMDGDARTALGALRRARSGWEELAAPYETARVRVLVALACRRLGDHDTAALELDAAAWAFRQLGAAPDVARVETLAGQGTPKTAGGLTGRELEVLRLVAAGKTNRAIADELFLSEKTVARHLSNIFTKLDVSSRAAATAYAYEHDLV